jgi:hypothetical protein
MEDIERQKVLDGDAVARSAIRFSCRHIEQAAKHLLGFSGVDPCPLMVVLGNAPPLQISTETLLIPETHHSVQP